MSKGHNHQYKEVHSKEHEHHENECCCHKEHEHHENESCCHKEHKHHENECCCHKEHEHHDKHCHCGEEHDHKHDHSHNHDSDEGCGCGCGHDHEHGGNVESKDIAKIFLATALLVIAVFTGKYAGSLADKTGISLGTAETVSLLLYLAAYFTVGGEVVRTAVKNICHGKVFDENFLMSVATVGAFLIGEYPEAVLVMLLYQIGEMFQSYAVGKSRKSITALMDIRPDVAYIKLNDGSIVKKEPKDVRIGEIIVVKPGEKVALDGKLAKGEGTVDEAALTGESLPREVLAGDDIMSGSISVSGVLEIEVEKEFSQSTVSKILELVENAGKKKAKTEKFISKFARYYTPIVVFLALALGVIPPIIEGISDGAVWAKWVYRALNFLVISCPCALVISVPLSFFAGIGGASSKGILIKGSSHLEALAKCNMVVFDKTGTLTKGNFKVAEIKSVSGSPEDDSTLLEKAVRGELFSNHPIAVSLKKQLELRDKELYKKIISITDSSGYEEISGYGIKADINGEIIYVGSKKLMDKFGISYKTVETLGTVVYVACGNKSQQATCLGYIAISDEMKSDAKAAIDGLKKIGIDNTVMLTGDRKDIADFVGGELGIDKIFGELLPADKVERMENFISEKKPDETIAFAGDGINDAPVLARADIGIAMGGLGQDVAIEAADVVIMDDKPSNIVRAIKIARKTMRIARENIVFALLIKVGVLILAVMGIASMWYAVFADVGVCVIAILNALRALKIDSKNS